MEELIIIKIKYVTALASNIFISGKNYLESAQTAELGLNEYAKLPKELDDLEEITQLKKDLESIKIRAEAKAQSKSAIDLRPRADCKGDSVSVAKSHAANTLGVFVVASTLSFLSTYLFLKMK